MTPSRQHRGILEPVSEAAVAADRPAPALSTGRRAACGRLAPPCRAGCVPAPHGSWLRGLKPREAESRRSPRGREGKGREGRGRRGGCQHPTLPCLGAPIYQGFPSSALSAWSRAPGQGMGLSPQTRGQSSGLGAELRGGSAGGGSSPLHLSLGQGCPVPQEGMGFVTDGSWPPSGGEHQPGGVRPAALAPGSAGSAQPGALASRPGKQRLVYLPNKPGEGGTGPTGPPPCSDARLGMASPHQPQTHVGAHGCLAPAPLLAPGEAPCRPGVPSLLPPAAVGCRGAGRVRHSW